MCNTRSPSLRLRWPRKLPDRALALDANLLKISPSLSLAPSKQVMVTGVLDPSQIEALSG